MEEECRNRKYVVELCRIETVSPGIKKLLEKYVESQKNAQVLEEKAKEDPVQGGRKARNIVSEAMEVEEEDNDPEGLKAEFRKWCAQEKKHRINKGTINEYLKYFSAFLRNDNSSFTKEGIAKTFENESLLKYIQDVPTVSDRRKIMNAQTAVYDFYCCYFHVELKTHFGFPTIESTIMKYLSSNGRKELYEALIENICLVWLEKGQDMIRNFIMTEVVLVTKSMSFLNDFTLHDFMTGKKQHLIDSHCIKFRKWEIPARLTDIMFEYNYKIRPTLTREQSNPKETEDEKQKRLDRTFFYCKREGFCKISLKTRAFKIEDFAHSPKEVTFKDIIDTEFRYLRMV